MRRFIILAIVLSSCVLFFSLRHAGGQTAYTAAIHHTNGAQSVPSSSADTNHDAWPDDPFATLNNGDLWLASTTARTVAALRWSRGTGGPPVALRELDMSVAHADGSSQRILIEAPGTIAQPGEIAVLLVGVAPDLESLLGADEAGRVVLPHDRTLLSGAPYIEISVLISPEGGVQIARIHYDARVATLNVYVNEEVDAVLTLNNFKLSDHMTLDGGMAYIGIIATTGIPEITNGSTILREWNASFSQSCEEVYWEKEYTPFNLDGYDADVFDHRITGTFLQAGDIIQEEVTHLWDDIGYLDGDIFGLTGVAHSYWRIVEDTRQGVTGLWRGRYNPFQADGEFDGHHANPQSQSLENFEQSGGTVGTLMLMQTMKYAKPNPIPGENPISTDIVIARHRIIFRFVARGPAFTANYPVCTFNTSSPLIFHQVVKKQNAFENRYGVWVEAIKDNPLIPCPP